MTENERERRPLEDPLAELERQLMAAYVAGAGENLHDLMARDDEAARRLLVEASRYASDRLTEVEARSHYLRRLHGKE